MIAALAAVTVTPLADAGDVEFIIPTDNDPPVIEPIDDIVVTAGNTVSFQIEADDDLTFNGGLRYIIESPLPPGVHNTRQILDRSTGEFSWTPDKTGVYPINLLVWDGYPPPDKGRARVSFTITVQDNPAPVIEPIDDIIVYLGQTVSFDVSATDIDTIGELRYILLDPLPPGVGDTRDILGWTTGHFSWTPDRSQLGVHPIKLLVWDGQPTGGGGRTQESFTITVKENPPPVIEPIGNIVVSAGQTASFNVSATDEGTIGGLQYSIEFHLPPGVKSSSEVLDVNTGHFQWTPAENHTGVHTFFLYVWDGQSDMRGITGTHFTVTVNGPVMKGFPTNIVIPEHKEYTYDLDFVPGITNHAFGLLDAPNGAEIDPATGVFRWTPSERQSLNAHNFKVIAMNSSGAIVAEQTVLIVVQEINLTPVIEPIDDIVVTAGNTVSFYVNGTDPDGTNPLRYILVPPLPPGVTDGAEILDRDTGHFEWTSDGDQTGVHPITVRVWDGWPGNDAYAHQSFTITVQDNPVPVIEPIDDIVVSAGETISFNVSATDMHTLGDLRYVLDPPLPPGVSDSRDILDRNTGHFEWTPNENQEGVHTINLRVWDGQSGNRGRAHQSFTITVNGPVMTAIPTGITIREHEEYTFNVNFVTTMSDHVFSGNTFGLLGGPDGAVIDPTTGEFSWTPSEVHGGKTHTFTVTAVDRDGVTVDEQVVTITVIEYNPPPVVEPIDDKTVYLGGTVSFNVDATDIDTYDRLQYFLESPLPPDLGHDILDQHTGHFSWTPGEDYLGVNTIRLRAYDGNPNIGNTRLSFNITVLENPPPGVEPIDDIVVSSGQRISFYVNATDESVFGSLRYVLDSPLPPGVDSSNDILDRTTGHFDWTPDENQEGVHTINLRVWDGQSGNMGRVQQSFTISVNGPVLAAIPHSATIPEHEEYTFDADFVEGVSGYTFGLSGQEPDGANIDPATGVFSWTPSKVQGGTVPNIYSFRITAVDGNGTTVDYQRVNIGVLHVNPPPVIEPIGDKTVYAEETVSFDVRATDIDTYSSLQYFLESPLPPDLGHDILDQHTGHFSWTPGREYEGVNTIRLRAYDGNPWEPGTTRVSFNITVLANPPPDVEPIDDIVVSAGEPISFYVNATDIGTGYLQYYINPPLPPGVGDGRELINSNTGHFDWTPSEDQRGIYTLTLLVWDGQPRPHGRTYMGFNVTVNGPVLAVIPASVTIPEQVKHTFDADFVAGISGHTFGLLDAPSGASINPSTGVFSWTPTEAQGGRSYTFKVIAVNGDGATADEQDVKITVTEHNPPPAVGPIENVVVSAGHTVSVYVRATDSETSGGLRYLLLDPFPPGVGSSGEILDRTTGHFEWTPNRAGVYPINLRVWDGQSGDRGSTYVSFNITVEANPVPDISPIDDIVAPAGQRISFYVNATDVDTFGGLRYLLLEPLPTGVSDGRDILDRDTGHFDWTPGEDQTGVHTIKLRVWDGQSGEHGRSHYSFKITVHGSILAAIPTGITIPEHAEYTFDAEFAEGASVTGHTFGLLDAPGGAEIDPATGNFIWTPSEDQGGKTYTFKVTAMNGAGAVVGEHTVIITVAEANAIPVMDPIDDIVVSRNQEISFYVNVTDTDDVSNMQYFVDPPLPPGVRDGGDILDRTTGYFEWAPDREGNYTINVRVWDGHSDLKGNASQSFNITVLENAIPDIDPIDDIVVSAGQMISFYISATDEDTVGGLRYIVLDPLPPGVSDSRDILDWTTGHFHWTPGEDQTGVHTINLRVWDGQPRGEGGRAHESFTITVNGPVLAAIPTGITIPEHERYTFDVDLTKGADVPGHTFVMTGGPDGARINPATGVFSWTPSEAQGGQSYTFTVGVTTGARSALGMQTVIITVTEANPPPFIEPIDNIIAYPGETVSFNVSATDVDTIGGLRYIVLDPLPPGVGDGRDILDQTTGHFSWTPDRDHIDTHTINLRVWDGQSGGKGSTYVSFNITVVGDKNPPPVIESIENIVVSPGERISFYVNATDEGTIGSLRYVFLDPLPTGVSDGRDILDRNTGHFDWTPDENQTGIHPINLRVWDGQDEHYGRTHESFNITVNGPVLAPIPNHVTIPEHAEYAFVARLVEDADVPSHTFGLLDAPGGAAINPSTGVFSWTPAEEHGPKSHTFTVIVMDGDGATVGKQIVTIKVNEVNLPPVINPIGDIIAYPGETVSFNVSATDGDTDSKGLRYILESPLPPGVGDTRDILGWTTGHFSWTPDRDHIGTHTINLLVWDGQPKGAGGRTQVSFNITVTRDNPPPVINPIDDIVVSAGQRISFYVNATDKNTIGDLRYVLESPLPTGVSDGRDILDRNTGHFDWTPDENQTGIHPINLLVWDGQSESRGETRQSFNITVKGPILAPIPTGITIPKHVEYTFVARLAEGANVTGHTFGLLDAPGGAEIDPSTGNFSWTPSEDQGGKSHTFTVTVMDGAGIPVGQQIVIITVTGDNLPPVIEPIDDIVVSAGQRISFYVNATDENTIGGLRYILLDPLPPGVNDGRDILNRDTGHFDWTPDENQTGVHTLNLRVWDGQPEHYGRTHHSFNITVNGAVLAAIPTDITIPEHVEYTFVARLAEGANVTGHTFGLLDAPGGAEIDPSTGNFSWTPSEDQGGKSHTFTVTVMDGDGSTAGRQVVTITVAEYNPPPVINPIDDITVHLGQTVSFNVSATDIDTEAKGLRYILLEPLPPGVEDTRDILGWSTGHFSWTPGETGVYTINLRVWDGQSRGEGGRTHVAFNITVIKEIEDNPPPVVQPIENYVVHPGQEIIFYVQANDTNTNGSLQYFLDPPLPPGVEDGSEILHPSFGFFDWTPNENHTGVHTFNVRVWDGQPDGKGQTRQSFNVTVLPPNEPQNTPPAAYNVTIIVAPLETRVVNLATYPYIEDGEQEPYTLVVTIDGTSVLGNVSASGTTITYTAANATGTENISYTVTDDGGLTAMADIRVRVIEGEPLDPIAPNSNATTYEDTTLTVTPSIHSPDGSPITITEVATYRGGTANHTATTITYTPRPDFNGWDTVDYTVTYGENQIAAGQIDIFVTPVNDPPVISGLENMTINELEPLNIPVTITDVENTTDQLTLTTEFMGAPGLPDGMEMTKERLTWTPTEAQGPGEYPFTVRVSDGLNQTTGEFTFTVNEVNQNPEFNITGTDHTAYQDMLFELDMNASDADLPEQMITCSITSQETGTVPAQIGPQTCIISWTPADLGDHVIRVQADDDHGGATPVTTININVRFNDVQTPVITLNNATQNPQIIELGDEYEELGATVSDDDPRYDGTVTIDASPVDINNTGNYTVTYTAPADPTGRTPEPVTRTVTVQDTTKPVIMLNGTSAVTVDFGGTYDERGAKVTDNDPDYTGTVTITTPEIDSSIEGATYTVTYSAPADEAGNAPDNVTRTVTIGDQFAAPNQNPIAQDATLNITEDSGEATVMPDINDPDMSGTLEIVSVGTPSKGEADFNSTDNTITYEPRENEHGLDMFNYTIEDNRGGTAMATVRVNITSVNDPPELEMIQDRRIDELVPFDIQLNATDVETASGDLVWTHAGAPAGLDITGNRLTWTPSESQGPGDYAFSITVSDGADSDSQQVTFTVNEVNQDPVLDLEDVAAFVNVPRTFKINATDADIPQQTLTYRFETGSAVPPGATLNLTTGIFSWTPAVGHSGAAHTVTVTVADDRGGSATGSFTVTVRQDPNRLMLVGIGDRTVPEMQELVIVLNATGTAAGELVYTATGAPAGLDITGNRLTWTPAEDQGGRDHTFTVTVADGTSTDSQTVTFAVTETNQDPVLAAINDRVVEAGAMLVIDTDARDGDIPEQTLVYNMTGHPAGATISGQGIFEWIPTAGQIDNYTITITVSDGQGGSASQTFNVNVTDAITGQPPVGRPNPDLVVPDILINAELFFPSAVTPAVADPAGGNVTITGVSEPALGILDTSMLPQISYTPNQTGIDILTYTVSDERGGTANGTISIFINPDGNARPVLDHIYNIGGRVGVDLDFTAAATDDENDPLTFDLANAPDGAGISTDGDFSWRPTPSQNGTHTVTFIVYDDNGGADWQDVLITILRADETNLPPVPQDIEATVVLGGGRGFQPDISDPENDGTEIVRVYDSSLGDVDRSFTSQGIIVYVAGVLGDDEVIYTVSDGRGGFANGTISITVEAPANVRPLIEFIGDKSVNANNTLTFTVVARDLDGVVTGFDLVGAPEGASMSPQGIFSWAPTGDDVGRYEFAVIVFDDAGENNTESITVTVRPVDYVNSPPVAPEVVIMTPQDVLSISRPTLTDPDEGDPVRITQTGDTTKGRILSGFLRAGIIIYLPNQGEFGTETVSYTVADSSNGNDTSTISIFISARGNTDPILGAIDFRNINAGNPLGFDLEAEDPDGDTISYLLVGAPDGIGISPEGRLSWTPAAADVGNHTFTIVAYDDRGGADSKSAVIRVLPAGTANQAPNAPDSSVTVAPGGSVVITPAISDPEGDRVTITDAVTSGTGVVIYSEDSMNYVHVSTLPTETITYTVTDARGATSTGTITITIQ